MKLVLPMGQGASWRRARELLDDEYEEVCVISVAATDSRDSAFSADTDMGEVLVVGRKTVGRKTTALPKHEHNSWTGGGTTYGGNMTYVSLERRPRTSSGRPSIPPPRRVCRRAGAGVEVAEHGGFCEPHPFVDAGQHWDRKHAGAHFALDRRLGNIGGPERVRCESDVREFPRSGFQARSFSITLFPRSLLPWSHSSCASPVVSVSPCPRGARGGVRGGPHLGSSGPTPPVSTA